MTSTVFISYRRDDTDHAAGRLLHRLEQDFARQLLVMDIVSLKLGEDFTSALDTHLNTCRLMLVLIGPHWQTAVDEAGRRRLDLTDDFVRLEIETALVRNIPVIPILVDGAKMPDSAILPAPLRPLAKRQGIALRHEHFDRDAAPIIDVLKAHGIVAKSKPQPKVDVDSHVDDVSVLSESQSQPEHEARLICYGNSMNEVALIAIVCGCLLMKTIASQIHAFLIGRSEYGILTAFDVSLAIGFFVVFIAVALIPLYFTDTLVLSNSHVVEVLRLVGATERYIIREFERQILRMLLRPIIKGMSLTVVVYLIFVELLQVVVPISRVSFWYDLGYVSLLMVLFCVLVLCLVRRKIRRAIDYGGTW